MKFTYAILYVDHVREMLDFYQKAFGFQLYFLHEEGDWGELDTGDTHLSFSSRKLMRQLGKETSQTDYHHPSFEFAFTTDNVEAALSQAINAGAILVQGIRHTSWGQTVAYVADPENNLIEICTTVG